MPLAAAAGVASAVAPPRRPQLPPPRTARPLRCFTQPMLVRGRVVALTVARCAPSPSPPPVAEAEAQPAKPPPRRYPRQYPGEAVGVAEEMRFVAMRLRNPKRTTLEDEPGTGAEEVEEEEVGDGVGESASASEEEEDEDYDGDAVIEEEEEEEEGAGLEGEWMPSMEGFVKYLVDSKLVFDTVERIVAESTDVAYVHFRKSGLERSARIAKDLEWFREQGIAIPEPSTPGSTYATYLTELAESNPPAFLSHYYNIYFAHTTGGVAVGNKFEMQ
ncbi:probable inactive heme oxygenase 2, chloroplastic isoform X2 [Oryza brachyantha]|uniref:probable inactive heme oxygenase 2, chloroplastic isoform X2 n=1 Tax=Oryza brachyantha TaxID=4533 RepID=UPI001ADBDC26|nr:probable inactive heme oxygenase 2, chloroplastic isoform X2 [Oryza brachyantha]